MNFLYLLLFIDARRVVVKSSIGAAFTTSFCLVHHLGLVLAVGVNLRLMHAMECIKDAYMRLGLVEVIENLFSVDCFGANY